MSKILSVLKTNFQKLFIKTPSVTISWIVISVVAIYSLSLKFWNDPNRLLVWDVKAYYVYLPAAVIYHDLSLKFVEQNSEELGDAMYLIPGPKGIYSIRTTYGMALLNAPFFLLAHVVAPLTGYAANGYTVPYRFALVIGSLFYLALGVIFLRKFLLSYFSQWSTAITLLAIVLGTNLLYYSTYESTMAHAYNFGIIAIFIYFTTVWYERLNWKNSMFMGFLIGLIVLVRPVNLLVIIFFILWGVSSWKGLAGRILFLLRSYRHILWMVLVAFIIWIPQFIYWKYISDSYLFYSYENQGFFFNNPQVFNSLLSYRKGLFVYIPLMLVAFVGIPFLYKKYRGLILPVGIFTILNVYILSSWCYWWFGGGFGPRSYIDSYAIFAIPFAAITAWLLKQRIPVLISFVLLTGTLIWYNFFETLQYKNGAINWMGMTREAYWNSFLQLRPHRNFEVLLRFPNYEEARKGIYYRNDLTFDEFYPKEPEDTTKAGKPSISLEDYIKNLDRVVRNSEEWYNQMVEKAGILGISLDSAIRRDGIWLYHKEYPHADSVQHFKAQESP